MIAKSDDARAQRLAAALRANLRRRKATTTNADELSAPDDSAPPGAQARPKGVKVGG